MSQNWPPINGGDKLAQSRADLVSRDEALKSNFSGTSFPTTNLTVGMFCYRADTAQLFELKSTSPAVTWVMIADLNTGFFNKNGDTMTGPLALAADPAKDLEAVTKRYADAIKTAALQISGGTMTGPLTLSGDPTLAKHAVTKQYLDGKAVSVGTGSPLAVSGTLGTGITLFHAGQNVTAGTYGGSSAIPVITVDQYGHVTAVGQAPLSLSNLLGKYGDTASEIYNNGWYRNYGSTGWFNQTFGGGIYMYEGSTVRVYGGKAFSTDWHTLAGGGNIWTSAYGWLHDRFASKDAEGALISVGTKDSGNSSPWPWGPSPVLNPAAFRLEQQGRQVQLVRVYGNCNCDCACTCFVAGTPVLMGDGTWKPVELVKVGDLVMTTDGPAEVWDCELPILGDRRLLRFAGDESGLMWSEEHPIWARRDGRQWWWTASHDTWMREVRAGVVPGLRDNGSMLTGLDGIEFAHIDGDGWRSADIEEVPAAPDTQLYFPKPRGSQTLILGSGWVFSGGTNEFTFDYTTIDWKGLK